MPYPAKYDRLIDAETWAFISRTEAAYPKDAASLSVTEQRALYDAMCREFLVGYPQGVSADNGRLASGDRRIPIRTYTREHENAGCVVVYYHGGGFVVGGLESHDDVCAEICGRTGLTVIAVDYRLSPEHPFPACFDDALAAFRHVSQTQARPVLLVGDSAGANLAASVCQATKDDARRPMGQVLIYGGFSAGGCQPGITDHADAPMLMAADIGFYRDIRSGGDPKASTRPEFAPLNATDFSGLPPTRLFAAECDPLVSDSVTYGERLTAAGVDVACTVDTGLVHGYLRARHSVTRARESFERIVEAISALGR